MTAAQTTLNGAISTAGATTCTVRDVLGFAGSSEASDLVLIESEFILVAGGLGTLSWTSLTRGYAGSTAATHPDGATVTRIERGYTDLTRVRSFMGETDTSDDADLVRFISGINAEITRRIGIALYPSTDTLRTYDGYRAVQNGRRLWIPGGIRSLTQVRIATQTGGAFTTATLGDFLVRPNAWELQPGRPYPYIDITDFPSGSFPYFPPAYGNIEFTGTYGPASVYGDLALLADTILSKMWDARGSGGNSVAVTPSKFIFAEDAAMLASYRSEVFSGIG